MERVGAYVKLRPRGPGGWRVEGTTLRLWLDTDGFERGDVSLPPGRVFLATPAWGAVLSRDKGILTIKQRRCGARRQRPRRAPFRVGPPGP